MRYTRQPSKGDFNGSPYVFVYGSLMKGFPNHRVLGDSIFIDEAVSIERKYLMYDLTNFPALVYDERYGDHVYGEVYRVDDNRVKEYLDVLEGYPDFYNRHIENFQLLNHNNSVRAWVYFVDNPDAYSEFPFVPDNNWKNLWEN
jgi:gamma-glutamylcyclotransferase (GGCT)/AIG2-like uncharacterized protein YtfP